MAEKILDSQIQLRNDTATNWATVNPILLKGEIGIEIDTNKFKFGDGVTAWSSLKYVNSASAGQYININNGITDEHVEIITKNVNVLIHYGTNIYAPTYFEGDLGDMYYTCFDGNDKTVYVLNIDWNAKTILNEYEYNLKTKVEGSTTNGNIKVDDEEITVYTLPNGVVIDENYVSTDNNFTNDEKDKLAGIEADAQTNKIEKIQKNGTELPTTNKTVNISVPVALSELTNDAGFIIKTVSDLTNYYAKTETYSKTEVQQLVNAISQFNALIVETLPTSNISTTTIYLVSKTDSETDDYYDEYLYINNAWEMIGNTKIDLSNYYTKAETYSRSEVQELVDGLGNNLEITNTQVNTNKTNIEALQQKAHEHTNKDILDATTEAFTKELKAWYDTVGENNHKHTNNEVLNKITQVYFDWWTEAYDAMHEHTNKDILDATTEAFTKELKAKLAGIESGANKTVVDAEMSETSTNPLQNKEVTRIVNAIEEIIDKNANDIVQINEDLKDKINETDIVILNCGNASGH